MKSHATVTTSASAASVSTSSSRVALSGMIFPTLRRLQLREPLPPSACVYVATAGAWTFVLSRSSGMPGMNHDDDFAELSMVAAMTLAMMLPLSARAALYVGQTALWHRRHELSVFYVAGFAGVWLLFALTAWDVQQDFHVPRGAGLWLAAAAVLSAVWPFTPWRWAADRRCTAIVALPAFGREASKRASFAGAVHGTRCVAGCGPAMLCMFAAPHLYVAGAIGAIQWYERRAGANPFGYLRARRSVFGYLAVAGVALAASWF